MCFHKKYKCFIPNLLIFLSGNTKSPTIQIEAHGKHGRLLWRMMDVISYQISVTELTV